MTLYGGFIGGATNETSASQRDPNSNKVILSGDVGANNADSYHVVTLAPHTEACVLDGFTIKGAYGSGGGSNSNGGGIFIQGSWTPLIANCKINSNLVLGKRGGCFVDGGGSALFVNCSFSLNQAGDEGNDGYGGALYAAGGAVELVNCTLRANSAEPTGGGMYLEQSSDAGDASLAVITNCTFQGNAAADSADGGGLFAEENFNLFIRSSIFWGNTGTSGADQDAQIYRSGDTWRVECRYTCIQTATGGTSIASPLNGTGTIHTDPNFVSAGTGNLRLNSGSPCLDTGHMEYLPCVDLADLDKGGIDDLLERLPKDLDLASRISCDPYTVDMGAYERPCIGGGSRPQGEEEWDPTWDCYFDDGTDEELAERCAS